MSPSILKPTTRERLVAGAERAVVAHGFQGTAVQHILDEAEVSRRTFYKHFQDKDDALCAVYALHADALIEAMDDALRGPVFARIDAAVDAYVAFQRERTAVVIPLQAEAIRPSSRLNAVRSTVLDRIVERIDASVREATGAALDPHVFRCLLLGLEGLVLEVAQDGRLDPEERIRIAAVTKALFGRVLGIPTRLPRRNLTKNPD